MSPVQWIVSTDKMSLRLRSNIGTSGRLEPMRTSFKSSCHLTHLTVSYIFLLEIIFQSNVIIRVPTVMEKYGEKSCHGKSWKSRGKLVTKIESWKLTIFPKSHGIYPLLITHQAREVKIIPYLHRPTAGIWLKMRGFRFMFYFQNINVMQEANHLFDIFSLKSDLTFFS